MKQLAIIIAILSIFTSSALARDNVVSSLHSKLKYLNERQSVLSHNVANADTPGYKARDLAPVDHRKMSKKGNSIKLATTAPGHAGGRTSHTRFKTVEQPDTYETTLNGNNVVLEEQMVKMANNDMEYQKTIGIIRQMTGMMRAAIGDNR